MDITAAPEIVQKSLERYNRILVISSQTDKTVDDISAEVHSFVFQGYDFDSAISKVEEKYNVNCKGKERAADDDGNGQGKVSQ